MKIQQLIEEQMKSLDENVYRGYIQIEDWDRNKMFIKDYTRKLIEALGSEVIGEDVSCARTTHFSDGSCCDYLGERNQLRAEQRLKLKEIISSLK